MRAIVLSLLFISSIFAVDDSKNDIGFVLIYDILVKNGVVIKDRLKVSYMMREIENPVTDRRCEFVPDAINSRTYKDVLLDNKDQVASCFFSLGIKLTDKVFYKQNEASYKTRMRSMPTYVYLKIKDGVVHLNFLKNR